MALLGHYKLDGNITNSVTGLTGSSSNVTYTTGKINQAADFVRANNSIAYLPEVYSFGTENNGTVSFWAIHTGLVDTLLLSSMVSNPSYSWIRFGTYIYFANRETYTYTSSIAYVPDGTNWHHYTFTFSTTKVICYIDGNKSGEISVASPWNIDIRQISTSGYIFDGLMDDLRFYDNILSPKEIEELSRAKVLHYDFNQFEEYTENIHDGTSSSLGGTLTDIGNNWSSLTFDGSSSGYRFLVPLAKLTNGATYTCSVEVMNPSADNITITLDWCDTGGTVVYTILPGERKVISVTGSIATYTSTFRFFDISNGTANATIFIKNIQIEQKDHATPYTLPGTIRTGTVTDKSGYGNDATLTATSPQWIDKDGLNNGCYHFDGTNKTIFIPNIFNPKDVTVCAWIKLNSITDLLDNTSHHIYTNTDGFGIVSGYLAWIKTSTGRQTITYSQPAIGTWQHITLTYKESTGELKLYINGEVKKSLNLTAGTPIVYGGTGANISLPGYNTNGDIDDVRIYATALSDTDVLELYQTKASVSNDYKLFTDQVIETGKAYTPSVIDYSTWILGSYGTQSKFGANGTNLENKIISYPNPNNVDDIVWASLTNDTASDAEGGFTSASFSIDITKKYRYSIWVRRENMYDNGYIYLGCLSNSVYNLGTTTKNSNPYLYSGYNTIFNNKWLLIVGYIHPTDYTGTTDITSGVYDPTTGKKIGIIDHDFLWAADATVSNLRSYYYYSTNPNDRAFFYRPRVDIIDGTEPTIQELLELRENPNLLTSLLPSNSIPWVYTETITKDVTGGFYKSSGSTGWDAQVYSKIGYKGGAYLRFRIAKTNVHFMVGLNQTTPEESASYQSIDYAWYQAESGNNYYYESGVGIDSTRTSYFPIGTILEIWYDNNNIYYYKDGTLTRTVSSIGSGRTFYIDSSFYEVATSTEINEIYFGPTKIPLNLDKYGDFRTTEINEIGVPENPLFFYNFDTFNENDAKVIDGSCNNNHAIVNGQVSVFGYNNGQAITTTSGTSYIFITGIPDFTDKSFSMGGWFKKDSGVPTNGYQRLFGRGAFDGTTSFYVNANGNIGFYYRNNGSRAAPEFPYTNETWVHVVAVVDKVTNLVSLYKDGILNSTASIADISGTFPSTPLYTTMNEILGGNGPAETIVCNYDDLFLYNVALNATEVKALYDKKPSNFKIMDNMNIQTTELIES